MTVRLPLEPAAKEVPLIGLFTAGFRFDVCYCFECFGELGLAELVYFWEGEMLEPVGGGGQHQFS